jgi:sec-independent protein translocase protein TatB
MFDFAWSELAVIAVVALVVIGPKDLPRTLRTVGSWVRRARAVAREFQSSLDQMVREADLDDAKKQIDKMTSLDLKSEMTRAVDPTGEIAEAMHMPAVPEPSILPLAPAAEPAVVADAPPAETTPPESASAESAAAESASAESGKS